MGFFSFVKNAVNNTVSAVSKTFGGAVTTIKHASIAVAKTTGQGIESFARLGGSVVKTVYSDGKDLVRGTGELISSTRSSFLGLGSSLGASFAWPLSLAAGSIGLGYLLLK